MNRQVVGSPYKKHKRTITPEKTSFLYGSALVAIILFLFIAPFQTGLFNGYSLQFERPIYSSILWSAILLLILSVYFLRYWKLTDQVDWLTLYIWLIPLSYWISSMQAASQHLADTMTYLHVMYAAFFIGGAYLAKSSSGYRLLQNAILLSGYVIVIFGLLNLFGNAYKLDAVMLTDEGIRLTSIFQYANAYAALLMALLLVALFNIVNSTRWLVIAGHSLLVVPIIVSFLLTLSRGGIVVLPITILFILPFLLLTKQILYGVYMLLGTAVALAITNKANEVGTAIAQKVQATRQLDGSVSLDGLGTLSLEGWFYVIAASLITAIILTLIQLYISPLLEKKLSKLNKFRYSSLMLPSAGIVLGILGAVMLFSGSILTNILPSSIRDRVENINFQQNSVLERITFYKDSIKMVKDYPILGAGGGGWAVLYEKYQNNPYISRQAHNFFLQYWLEVGVVGMLLLSILIVFIFYRFIRTYVTSKEDNKHSHFVFYIVTVSLLLHSIIDFEMSYAFLAALVFLCLGGMASYLKGQPLTLKGMDSRSKWSRAYPVAIGVLAIVIFAVAITNLKANRLFNQAVQIAQLQKPFQEVLVPLDQALDLQPEVPEIVLTKANMLTQVYNQTKDEKYYSEAMQLTQSLKQSETQNRQLMEQEYDLYTMKNQLEDALKVIQKGLTQFTWEISVYERAILLHTQLGEAARSQANYASMNQHWEESIRLYNTVLQKTKHLESLPEGQLQGRDFNVTPSMKLSLGQVYYIRGDYKAASEIMQGVVQMSLDQPVEQQIARWYLASLRKQGKEDKALYDKLIAKVPNEKTEIDRIMNTSYVVK